MRLVGAFALGSNARVVGTGDAAESGGSSCGQHLNLWTSSARRWRSLLNTRAPLVAAQASYSGRRCCPLDPPSFPEENTQNVFLISPRKSEQDPSSPSSPSTPLVNILTFQELCHSKVGTRRRILLMPWRPGHLRAYASRRNVIMLC